MSDETLGIPALIAQGFGAVLKPPRLGARGLTLILGFVVLGWLATSVYRVQPDEQGVVLRFGRWIDTTGPGLHVHWPFPIETVLFPTVTKINQIQLGGGLAPAGDLNAGRERQTLTGDENIVEADAVVFWKVRDAGEFLFRVAEPEAAVKIAAEGALRDIISRTPIQAAMSNRRQEIAEETRTLLQKLLDAADSGVEITQVQLLRVEPPLAVIDAFNDVQRALADQERARNEAEAYSNDILPRARGEADHTREDAEAYRASVASLADGEAQAFLDVLAAYRSAPVVTSWRLYLEAVDELLRRSSRVLIDTSDKGFSGVTPYMSLDGLRPAQPYQRPAAPPPILDVPAGGAPIAPRPQGATR
jgi:modulator of FtsH protease HflK